MRSMWLLVFLLIIHLISGPVESQSLSKYLTQQTKYNVSKFLAMKEVSDQLKPPKITAFAILNSGIPTLTTAAQRTQLAKNVIITSEHTDLMDNSMLIKESDYGFGNYRLLSKGNSRGGAAIFLFLKANVAHINMEKLLTTSTGSKSLYFVKAPISQVAYFQAKLPLPLGVDKKFYEKSNSFLQSNTSWSQMYTYTNTPLSEKFEIDLKKYIRKLEQTPTTYFITTNAGWNSLSVYTKTLKTDQINMIIYEHFIMGIPYFIHFVPGKTPAYYDIKQADTPYGKTTMKIVFRSRNGTDYLISSGVKSTIVQKNYPIILGVAHVVNWPVGVRFGTFQETLNVSAKAFLKQCQALNQKGTNCSAKLTPVTTQNTILAPQTFIAPSKTGNAQLMNIMNLHFFTTLLTEYNMEFAYYNNTPLYFQKDVVTARVNFGVSNKLFIDVRPLIATQKMMGYVSAFLITSDIARSQGNIQIVSQPYGIYNYNILSYLKTRPDLYSTFLKLNKDSILPLTNATSNMTVIVPTNAAFALMNASNVNNGQLILKNNAAIAYTFKRFVIPKSRIMVEDWKTGACKTYSTLNTPVDKIRLKFCKTLVNAKIQYLTVTIEGTSQAQGRLSLGAIGASNGIIYPLENVLYQSTDINGRYVVNNKGIRLELEACIVFKVAVIASTMWLSRTGFL